ncbi:MAG: hypothetical protein RLY31_830 [Bacteroidota bacterium]
MNLISKLRGWLQPSRPAAEVLLVFGSPEGWSEPATAAAFPSDPVFRASILRTDQLVRQTGHASILPHFHENHRANNPIPPENALFVGMAAELAILDQWLDRGLQPTAALGIGLGELTALCAAGAISREQAVALLSDILRAAGQALRPMAALYLPDATIDTLPADLPCPVFPAAMLAPQGLVVLCEPEERHRLEQALTRQGVAWRNLRQQTCLPFHTPLAASLRPALSAALENIVPGPTGFDYYPASLGRLISAHTPPPHHLFEDMMGAPVRLDLILPLLQRKPWHTIGHCSVGMPTSLAGLDRLSTIHRYGTEQTSPAQLPPRRHHRRPPPAAAAPDKAACEAFVNHTDILHPANVTALPAIYGFLRPFGGIHFFPKNNCWLVLNYELATRVMQDHDTFSNQAYHDEPFLLGADPPDHTHMRSVVQPQFAPKAIRKAADRVDEDVRELRDSLLRQPGFDVALDWSIPIVQSAVGRFLGLDERNYRALLARMPRSIYETEIKTAVGDFFTGYMEDRQPGSTERSMKNYLLHAVDTGAIRMEQAVGMMNLFWDAGIFTTSLHLTNLVYELLTRPAVAKQLQADPGLVSNFIGECLRLYPPGIQVMRTTKREVELGGMTVPAGSLVAVGLQSANRDPDVFPHADTMLLNRPARRDFVFGGGIHFCPGHHLAKREADAVVHSLLPVLDRLELDPRRPAQRLDRVGFSGMTSLPVRWR